MRKIIIITIRNLFILVISVSLVVATQSMLQRVRAGDNESVYDADKIKSKYHEAINDIFNDKIKVLVALGNSQMESDFKKMLKLVSPPEFEKDESGQLIKRKECDGENLSTYCLAMASTNKYFVFRADMLKAREQEKKAAAMQFKNQFGKEPKEAQPEEILVEQRTLFGTIGDMFQGQKAMQGYGEALNDIDREIDISRQAIDQTLKTYNEMQMALVMHSKYKKIIKSLEDYRDKISEIRKEVDLYPFTFLDLTTTACT